MPFSSRSSQLNCSVQCQQRGSSCQAYSFDSASNLCTLGTISAVASPNATNKIYTNRADPVVAAKLCCEKQPLGLSDNNLQTTYTVEKAGNLAF